MKKIEKKKFLLEQKRKKFIELMIIAEGGEVEGIINAYMKVYPQCKKREAARASGYKLLLIPEIKEAILEGRRKREEELRQARRQEEIRIAREQVADESELDAQMSKIALGKLKLIKKQLVKFDDGTFDVIDIEEGPTENGMVQAAKELYKRKGSYAPIGIKHDATDKFLEFAMHVQTTNNNSIPNHVQPGSDK